jgi:crotonobetainyl-CoA:carnitine CoA-transferase CaiB-like acyl-CoA transferase
LWGGPVYTYADVESDRHVEATDMIVAQQAVGEETIRTLRVPIRMSETPPSIRRGAPRLGQDSRAVLKEFLGYEDALVAELLGEGVIAEYVEEGARGG